MDSKVFDNKNGLWDQCQRWGFRIRFCILFINTAYEDAHYYKDYFKNRVSRIRDRKEGTKEKIANYRSSG